MRHGGNLLGERAGGAPRVDAPERRVGQRVRYAHAGLVALPRWHSRRRVRQHGASTLFIFYCVFACLSYLSAGTHCDRF